MDQFAIDFRQLGEASSSLIVAFDSQFRYTYVNPQVERLIATPRERLIGRTVWEVAPHTEGTVYGENYRRAMRDRVVVEFEAYYPPLDRWNHVRCVPEAGGGLIVFARNITDERRAEAAREAALSLLNAVIGGTTDMVAAMDRERRFLLANGAAARFLGLSSPDEIIGKTDFDLLTSETDRAMLRRLKPIDDAVMESGEARAFEFVAETTPTGDGPRTYLSNKAPLRDPETGEVVGLVNIIHDITERKRAERRLRRLFDSQVVGVIFWNLDTGLITDANAAFLSMVGYTHEDLEAGLLDFRKMTPPEWEERNEQGVATIRAEGCAPAYEKEYFRKDGSRVPILIGGTLFEESGAEGFSYILDITERKRREERESARLKDIFMRAPAFMATTRGPQHVFEMANPPYYQLVGHRDILGKPVAVSIPEVVEQGFISILDQVYRTGEPFIGKDVRLLLQMTPDGPLEERFVDFAYQPLYDEDRQVSGILAHGIDLTERKRLEIEQERLLNEARARAEREALLNRIGQTIRGAPAPQQVLEAAVGELGRALGADRCYYAAYDQNADRATVGPEWCQAGLAPLAGQYRMSNFAVNRSPDYTSGRTQVIADVRDDPAVEGLGLRALLRVPLVSGPGMTAMCVAMSGGPREWTAEEVSLVETVATQTQTALEAVRMREREHRIAEELARALQPPTPPSVPGLALADYYRPAWEDQGVGGDFSDVFSDDKGVTFLVIGDLSGKGLAAASQVATVRHMLRFALINGRSVAGPLTALNHTLADHELLTGFATLFVGRFDAATLSLTYVNCGQDAGLVLRAATGRVEPLPPTGPVLGAVSQAVYAEETVVLQAGDALALYTDGLTEAGPTRTALLTGDGVAGLLCRQAGLTDPKIVVERLMAGVDAYAGTGVRDDQCLLVGVVSG